jgi:hypothetical protein
LSTSFNFTLTGGDPRAHEARRRRRKKVTRDKRARRRAGATAGATGMTTREGAEGEGAVFCRSW